MKWFDLRPGDVLVADRSAYRSAYLTLAVSEPWLKVQRLRKDVLYYDLITGHLLEDWLYDTLVEAPWQIMNR